MLCAAASLHAQAYRFGKVWDGEKLIDNAVIVVDHGEIRSVGASSADAINMSRYTAIPGMIDVHTHMTYVLNNPVGRAGRGAATVYLSQDNAKKTLENRRHVTVRDLGAQELCRHRHARLDRQRINGWTPHVRIRIRPSGSPRRPWWTRRLRRTGRKKLRAEW